MRRDQSALRHRGCRRSGVWTAIVICSTFGCGSPVIDPGTQPTARLPAASTPVIRPVSDSASTSLKQVSVTDIVDLPHRPEEQQYHEVRQGDSLSSIARTYKVTLPQLLRANGLDSGAVIRPGELIYIPPAR